MRHAVRTLLLLGLPLAACSHNARVAPEQPNPPRDGARSDAGSLAPAATTTPGATAPDAVTPTAQPSTVKIWVRTAPQKIMVSWGKKHLGLTPLTIERPRESGPVDLVLRGSGYFPVHSRAYTFKNDTISVKMTKLANRMMIFGAKQELPPEGEPGDPALDPANAALPPSAPPPSAPPPPVTP